MASDHAKAFLDILNGMTEDNCERTYHDFYRG